MNAVGFIFRWRGLPDLWIGGENLHPETPTTFRWPFRISLAELKLMDGHGGNLRGLQRIAQKGPFVEWRCHPTE